MSFALAVAVGGAATLIGAAQPWFKLKVPESANGVTPETKPETRKCEEKVDSAVSAA